jgi:hypothetical protein
MYVPNVSCFRRMLQVLHLDVAKVDLNVIYVLGGVCDPQGFPYACGK